MKNPVPVPAYLIVPVLLLLFLDGLTSGHGSECAVEARVRRNTTERAVEHSSLTIHCPVKHCGLKAAVTWCKMGNSSPCLPVEQTDHIEIHWKPDNNDINGNISQLTFTRITMDDAGLYRCKIDAGNVSSVSHTINVSVTSHHHGNVSNSNTTTSTEDKNGTENPFLWLPYLYICVSIAALVVIVMLISCLTLRWCDASKPSAKAEQTDNEYSVPLTICQATASPSLIHHPRQQPIGHSSESTSSLDNHGGRKTFQKNHGTCSEAPPTRTSLPSQLTVMMDGLHDDVDSSPILYAALNHEARQGGQVSDWSHPPEEEQSEYAAIRVS